MAAKSASKPKNGVFDKNDEKPAGVGHNSGEVGGVAGAHLKSLLERIERLTEEKDAIGSDVKAVYAEGKSTGFDTKTMRRLIRERKMDREKLAEQTELYELYTAALGGVFG